MKVHAAAPWLLCSLILALAVTPALAQQRVVANIPFNFVVQNTTMTAGQYTVNEVNDTLWAIRSVDGSEHALITTGTVENNDSAPTPSRLVFHRYGDEYFLSEIWVGGSLGRRINPTRHEMQLSREFKPAEVHMQLSKVSK